MAKYCIAFVLVVLACVYSLCSRVPAGHEHPKPSSALSELLVIVNPDVSEVAVAALAGRHALVLSDTWRIGSLDRDCYVFSGSEAELAAAHDSLVADPAVESVHTARIFHVAAASEPRVDPYVNLQHSLISARIDEAHQLSTGAGVKVAIIDTGLDRTHYDLRGRVEAALNFVDADQTIEIVEFHATAVAGIIGAAANNGRGIVGIAPDARLYSLRACWESIPGTSRGQCSSFGLARALDWAITNDMKVVNMSLQGQFDPLVSRLISRATQQGLVVVAATDLGDEALSFPAAMREVIAVSYHDPLRTMDYTRNAGKVFIAPGEEILTTMPDNTYDFVSGSSFASAHVAGIVALLAEHVPDIDAHTVRAVLRSSIRIANWDVTIDACTALGTVIGSDNCRPPPP